MSALEDGADRKTDENIEEKVETVGIAGLANSLGGGGGGGADEVYVSRRIEAEIRTSGRPESNQFADLKHCARSGKETTRTGGRQAVDKHDAAFAFALEASGHLDRLLRAELPLDQDKPKAVDKDLGPLDRPHEGDACSKKAGKLQRRGWQRRRRAEVHRKGGEGPRKVRGGAQPIGRQRARSGKELRHRDMKKGQ